MDIPDGLPKWNGLKECSNLVEGGPRQLVEKMAVEKEAVEPHQAI